MLIFEPNYFRDDCKHVVWSEVLETHVIPDDIILTHLDKMDAIEIVYYQKLSEKTIEELVSRSNLPRLWFYISKCQDLTEDFIRRHSGYVDWGQISLHQNLSEPFMLEFEDKINWSLASAGQQMGSDLIRKKANHLCWLDISAYQTLSPEIIDEFHDLLAWGTMSYSQNLSEKQIEKYEDLLDWSGIWENQNITEAMIDRHIEDVLWTSVIINQKLSEDFLISHHKYLTLFWTLISKYQVLSDDFLVKYGDVIDIDTQKKTHHDTRNRNEKQQEMKQYADKHSLFFDGERLYAFRNHDKMGRGAWKGVMRYTGGYYKDWRCDLDPDYDCSFGLGIFPEGNTPVQVKVEDWGCAVASDRKGKARVFGFKMF